MLQQSVFLLNTVLPKIQDLISESCQKKYKVWSKVLHLSCMEVLARE